MLWVLRTPQFTFTYITNQTKRFAFAPFAIAYNEPKDFASTILAYIKGAFL